MYYNTQLTPELRDLVEKISKVAKDAGLDCFETIFELVDYQQLNEIAAYGGFPTRYPHWKWGMDYERLSKSYEYGLSIIYEMVINNDPCYAYLLRANNLVSQKMVIAHVYGHCDFFKNNYWFKHTNRKMLDQMANHSTIVRRFFEEVGQEEVEDFLDVCLSLENLIDIYLPFNEENTQSQSDDDGTIKKLQSKKYMDSYINPKEFINELEQQKADKKKALDNYPTEPQTDVLKFLMENAPLNSWQKRILRMVRDEMYYFAPQAQTKIINEGWASYWHSKIMTQLFPLDASEIITYCDLHSGVVSSAPGQLNPYKLGIELFRHIENRWDKGRFGLEYTECKDRKTKESWDTGAGLGKEKIFEVRKIHNDITFIDNFLDEEFCHQHKMFIYDYDKRTGKPVISSRDLGEVKTRLLSQLTNFGQPIIQVIDANYKNRSELLLKHKHSGVDLKKDFAIESLKNLFKIWKRPVHITTTVEKEEKIISFDGNTHTINKAS